MSMVREVPLRTIDGNLRLMQKAAGDPGALVDPAESFSIGGTEVSDGVHVLDGAAGSVQRINITFTPGTAREFELAVGRTETMTHDYKRHDNIVCGLGRSDREGHWFLPAQTPARRIPGDPETINKEVPQGLDVHLILDNYVPPSIPR